MVLPDESCIIRVNRDFQGVKQIKRVIWPEHMAGYVNEREYEIETGLGWATLVVLEKEKQMIIQFSGEGSSPPQRTEEQAPILLKTLLSKLVAECTSN